MYSKEFILSLGIVKDNEFLDKYINIVSADDAGDNTYKHHIIPKSYYKNNNLDIDNTRNNIVKLSYVNHVLAHYYLSLCACDSVFKRCNIAATMNMVNEDKFSNITEEFIKSLDKYEDLRTE